MARQKLGLSCLSGPQAGPFVPPHPCRVPREAQPTLKHSRRVPAVPLPSALPPAPPSTHLMHLIHSSFSSGVGAEMRYTVWFPSTTRPSASVLQALITWSLLSGM